MVHKLLAAVAVLAGLLAPASAATYAWIGHSGGVAAIDVERNVVAAQIATPFAVNDVAALPGVRRAYAAGPQGIVAIDTSALAMVAASPSGPQVFSVELKPGGEHLYATVDAEMLGQRFTAVVRTDILTTTRHVLTSGSVPDEPPVYEMQGGMAYFPPNVEVDLASDQVQRSLPVSGVFEAHPVLRRLYVVSGNTVQVFDLETNTVVASTAVVGGGSFVGARLNGGATRLFVTDQAGNAVYVLDAGTLQVLARLDVGTSPRGIDITPNGDRILVVNEGSGDVSVIDPHGLGAVGRILVGANPRANGRFIGGSAEPVSTLPGPGTGLWWNTAEPGWGLHVTQRGSIFFAVLFHYDAAGVARWWVAPSCRVNTPCPNCIDNVTCQGPVYDATGPAFFFAPFSPNAVGLRERGIIELKFTDRDRAHLTYVIDGSHRSLSIVRQDFAPRTPLASDYTDLWWNPLESGWGIGITQRSNVMFITWFVYDALGLPQWLVASNCAVSASGNGCSGKLYRTSGPAGPAPATFNSGALGVTEVGEIEVAFDSLDTGLITWTVEGQSGARSIVRQLF